MFIWIRVKNFSKVRKIVLKKFHLFSPLFQLVTIALTVTVCPLESINVSEIVEPTRPLNVVLMLPIEIVIVYVFTPALMVVIPDTLPEFPFISTPVTCVDAPVFFKVTVRVKVLALNVAVPTCVTVPCPVNAPNSPKANPTTTKAIITDAITNINAVTAPDNPLAFFLLLAISIPNTLYIIVLYKSFFITVSVS
uniref:Orf c01022 protein n=1 Tax=Saccharolobus solfataricus TaxID=2287 RepID=P95920_SACSO|nr:orf c01022 [Saccharolobus solfataricus P2]